MQVLLFFGQGGKKNAKQIETILQQALVMLKLLIFFLSAIILRPIFNRRSCSCQAISLECG